MFLNKTFGILLFTTLFTSALIYFSSLFSISNAASTTLSFTIVAATGAVNTGNNNTGAINTGNNNTGAINTGNNNTGAANTGNNNTGAINIGAIIKGNNSQNTGITIQQKKEPKDISTGDIIVPTGNSVETGNKEVNLVTDIEGLPHGSSVDTNQEKSDGKKIENKERTKIYNRKNNNEDYEIEGLVDNGVSCNGSQKTDNKVYKKIINDNKTSATKISDDERINTSTKNIIVDIFFSIKNIFIMTGNKNNSYQPICYTGEYYEEGNEDKSTGFNYIITGSGSLFTTIIKLIINYFN